MIALTTLLGSLNDNELFFPMGIAIVGMAIPIVAIVTDFLSKISRMRLVEKAIEHGASLDNLNFDDAQPKPRMPYRSGMVCFAIGIALIVVAQVIGIMQADFRAVLLVGGAITGAIGLALLVNDWMNRDRFDAPTQ